MKTSYLCIMTLWFCLLDADKLHKRHVTNSVVPTSGEPSYNITAWVKQLHLQQCVLVEIGEKYCGIYVEYRELTTLQLGTDVQEYFLGLCDTETLRRWKFCSADLEQERPTECVFNESTEYTDNPARVHRRLCDVTAIAIHGELCNCDTEINGKKMYRVTGFPTCFLSPLPESLCVPRNVCGVAKCTASTVNQQVHTVRCNAKCLGGQPFCELPGPQTSRASVIESYWTDWNEDLYDYGQEPGGFVHTEAMCVNKNTGMGAIDCLGPGTNCCPAISEDCKCYIYIEDGILKLFRKYRVRRQNPDLEYCKHFDKPDYALTEWNLNKMSSLKKYYRKDVEEYEDGSDDEDDEGEDVVMEESEDDADAPVATSEKPEDDEIRENMNNEKNDGSKNGTLDNPDAMFLTNSKSFKMQSMYNRRLNIIFTLVLLFFIYS